MAKTAKVNLDSLGWKLDPVLDSYVTPNGLTLDRSMVERLSTKELAKLLLQPGYGWKPPIMVAGNSVRNDDDELSPWKRWHITPDDRSRPPEKRWSLYVKLAMRLNLPEGETFGFDNLNICEAPNKVFVFIVMGDDAVILEDEPSMFPSDRLVAKIRLLQK